MAYLDSLRSDLTYWNNQISALNDRVKKLKKRRGEVENVGFALKSVSSGNANAVNDKIRSTAQKLESSIDYSGKEDRLDGIFADKREQSVGGDELLSSAAAEIQRETDDVNRQLGEAESDLSRAHFRVRDIRAAIASEERRRREEAARNYRANRR